MPLGSPRPLVVMAACLVVAGAAMVVACTSTPPTPSSGTFTTPAPTLIDQANATAAPPSQQAPTATTGQSSQTLPPPTQAGTAAPTPAPTVPPAAAIGTELVAPGSLTVCLALVGAPAATLNDDDQVVGYNVAFANELASRLDLQVVIQQTDFSELMTNIQSHSCDLSVSSQNITAGRIAQMNLVPYTQSKLGFPVVVAAGNPKKVKALDDLCGLAVSAAAGTTSVDQVNGVGDYVGTGLNDNCLARKNDAIDLRVYPSELDAVQALMDGAVNAYLGNANFVAQYPDVIEKSDATLPPTRQGIAVALDHPVLTSGIDVALGEMISDGTYLQILRQYLPSESVDNFSIIESQ